MMSLSERVSDAGFAAGWALAQRVPDRWARKGADAAADSLWRRQGSGVRQLRANLARVLGPVSAEELDATTHEAMRCYLRYWVEAFQLPSWSTDRITSTFVVEQGLERLDAVMAQGRGAVIALPHMGNWDHAGAWACLRFGGLTTVAERLRPESLYDRFVAYRESLGMTVLPLGDPDALRQLARRLRAGELICLLADRDLKQRGVSVSFFGEEASMPPGPAMLSVMTGAPLFPVSTWHEADSTHAIIHAPLTGGVSGGHHDVGAAPQSSRAQVIADITQQLADSFETSIREHPADWHMMQRLWHVDVQSVGNARSDAAAAMGVESGGPVR
jgi:phosphatidylinositol dimannoside acyltransferase